MATFRNRNGKWQARIQRQGQVPVSKSLNTHQAAERWARQVEAQMDQGKFVSLRLDERTTLGGLVTRYMAEVTPLMKSAEADLISLVALKRNPLCNCSPLRLDIAVHRRHVTLLPAVASVEIIFFITGIIPQEFKDTNSINRY